MPLQVYDHLTRVKKQFEPVRPGRVGLYVCGMTVQDKPHVGHMFAFVACDMIRRYLEFLGYAVTHVQNFTDIDDKIIERARAEGVDYRVVAERNMALYFRAADALGIRRATHYPLATEHIPEIVDFISRLIARGHAYAAGGDVYFSVRSDADYGRLSGRQVDDMRAGVRIEVGDRKVDPLDFALWKSSPPDEPGWDSPWGRGRPGWHIECSAMSTKYLGDHFDFHGGGRDLLFPHHENERAQSICATGHAFVNFWLHNGLLFLGDKKMSKSDGNFFAMEDVLAKFPAHVVRFFLLNAHFRSQIDYGEERLQEAAAAHERLARAATRLLEAIADPVDAVPEGLISLPGEALAKAVRGHRRAFFAAMDDDFNSAGAIGALFGLARDLNQYFAAAGEKVRDAAPLAQARRLLAEADRILGIFPGGLESLPSAAVEIPADLRDLAVRRDQARAARDWALADRLRAEIQARGYQVEDGPDGSTLRPRQ